MQYIEITLLKRWYGCKPIFYKNKTGRVRRGKFYHDGWVRTVLWLWFSCSVYFSE
jgi:hypothetical protein